MTELTFNIRPVRDGDFAQWFRLRKLLWDGSSDSEHREEMIDIIEHTETQLVLVAETAGDRLVGFLEASIRPFVEDCYTDHVGYLEGWFVEPDFRRHGIGRQLVKKAEDWARSKGCEEMASDSEIGNNLSLDAHLKFGYRVTSKLVHLKKDLV
jgi:aminoglycoside 6'-N-acetyltransferase I